MTTVATVPEFAPPNRDVKVLFSLTHSTANFVRVWVTAAPPGSELRKKLDDSGKSRLPLYEGEGESKPELRKFDAGGKYTLVAQEYKRGASTYGGGYQGAPDGNPSEDKIGDETTLELFIGQRLTSALAVGPDTLTVVLWVWNDTVRRTLVDIHGEESPIVQATSKTPKAVAAAESDATIAAAADLVDSSVSGIVGDVGPIMSNLVSSWNAHLIQSGVHAANDTLNAIPSGVAGAVSTASVASSVTELLPLIRQHYTNDATKGGTVSGRDTAGFHKPGSLKVNDNANLPIVSGASQLGDAYWAVAEVCRSVSYHMLSSVHLTADTVNLPPARPPLMRLGELILGVLSAADPVTPPTQSDGAMLLISRAGFEESPLG